MKSGLFYFLVRIIIVYRDNAIINDACFPLWFININNLIRRDNNYSQIDPVPNEELSLTTV